MFVTAYLGGAVAANVRVLAPLFGYVLFPVVLWLGLYLRGSALRQLVWTGY